MFNRAFQQFWATTESGPANSKRELQTPEYREDKNTRLMAEQKDEDDHKLWCDVEASKSSDKKANREEKVEL